jgi:hypothetical protein
LENVSNNKNWNVSHFWLVTTAIATAIQTGVNGFIGIIAVRGIMAIAATHYSPTASPKSFVDTLAGISRRSRFTNLASTAVILAITCHHRRVKGYDAAQ